MADSITDDLLIKKYLKSGDEESLRFLFSQYLKIVYNFSFYYLGNYADAQDVTQEVFIKVWRNLKKFDTSKNFKVWVLTIAKNTCLDFLKKKKNIPFSAFEDEKGDNVLLETLADPEPMPDEIFAQKDVADFVSSALEQLPANYRVVLSLYYKEQLNFREISEALAEPINTVKSRHRRALILLKTNLLHQNDDYNRINK
ncbi:MAG: RNA polymerase sigma factor [Candidatus Buchananbacteria bacterium]